MSKSKLYLRVSYFGVSCCSFLVWLIKYLLYLRKDFSTWTTLWDVKNPQPMLRSYVLVFYMLNECHYFGTNEFLPENLVEISRFYREGNRGLYNNKSFAFIHKMNCFLDIPPQPSAIWKQDLNSNKVDDHKETFWELAYRLVLQRLESNTFCWRAVHQVKFSWKNVSSLKCSSVNIYSGAVHCRIKLRVAEHSPSKVGSEPELLSQPRGSHWVCPPSIQLREMFMSVLFLQPCMISIWR